MLMRIYERLLDALGAQGWWPVGRGLEPPEWEVMAGAVLTQNTTWSNVERALENLAVAGIRDRESLLEIPEKELAELIKPSGYYNQKARKLRILAGYRGEPDRVSLLNLWGIGPETADSILLYGYGRPNFVVDAYTRRVFSRLGLIDPGWGYERTREFFEGRLPRDPAVYREYHALIVRLAKTHCKPRPSCGGCPMKSFCNHMFKSR
jgi:endonuclease-3 related protein